MILGRSKNPCCPPPPVPEDLGQEGGTAEVISPDTVSAQLARSETVSHPDQSDADGVVCFSDTAEQLESGGSTGSGSRLGTAGSAATGTSGSADGESSATACLLGLLPVHGDNYIRI